MSYFYIDSQQQQQGPIDISQFLSLGVRPDTYVWTQGMNNWEQAQNVPELKFLFSRQDESNTQNNAEHQPSTIVSTDREDMVQRSSWSLFLPLIYAVLWFAGAGLIIWALVFFFTESKGGRIKVMGFIAPFYFVWYGLKSLWTFIKMLFQ